MAAAARETREETGGQLEVPEGVLGRGEPLCQLRPENPPTVRLASVRRRTTYCREGEPWGRVAYCPGRRAGTVRPTPEEETEEWEGGLTMRKQLETWIPVAAIVASAVTATWVVSGRIAALDSRLSGVEAKLDLLIEGLDIEVSERQQAGQVAQR